jgi:hypothetical protein
MKDDVHSPTEEQINAQKKYHEMEIEEMLGSFNMYCSYLELGRKPDNNEAAMHYVLNGGAEKFHKKYGHLLCLLPEEE